MKMTPVIHGEVAYSIHQFIGYFKVSNINPVSIYVLYM